MKRIAPFLLVLLLIGFTLSTAAQAPAPTKIWEGKKEVVYTFQLDNGSILIFERSKNALSSNENNSLKLSIYNGISTEDLGIEILTKSVSERVNMLSLGNGDYIFTIRDASLHLWRSKNNSYKKLDIVKDKSATNIYSVKKDSKGIYCVVRSGGSLFEAQWNGANFEKKNFLIPNDNPNLFRISLERLEQYNILSTRQQGIHILDKKGKLVKKIGPPDQAIEKNKEEARFYFRYMEKYKGGILGFAGHRGPALYVLDTINFELTKFKHQFPRMGNHIYMFRDERNRICIQNDYSLPTRTTELMWLDQGSMNQEVRPRMQILRNSQQSNPFDFNVAQGEMHKVKIDSSRVKYILPKKSLRAVMPYKEGLFWIGLNSGAIHELNTQTNTTRQLTFVDNKNTTVNFHLLKKIVRQGNSYITNGGNSFYKFKPNKKIIEENYNPNGPKRVSEIGGWILDKGNLYFGKLEGPIFQYNLSSNELIPFDDKANLYVQDIIKEEKCIYAATNKGLKKYEVPITASIKDLSPSQKILQQSLLCIYPTKKYLWIGTENNGLIRWDRKKEIKTYGDEQGIDNASIVDIIRDSKGRIWAATLKGVYILESEESENTYAPFKSKLSNIEFNRHASFAHTDGTIFLGSLYGMYYFHENDVPDLPPIPKLYLNSLEYFKDTAVQKTFCYLDSTKSISIPVEHKYLNLSFSQSDIASGANQTYYYKLNNEKWKLISTGNYLELPFLPPGNQTLHIKAHDAFGREIQNRLKIYLAVENYFYKSWWFLSLLVLTILGITFFWIKRLRKEKIILEEKVQLRTATIEEQKKELQSLDQLKNRFFSNISHELRTPLTLILSPLRKLLKADHFANMQLEERKETISVMHSSAELLNERIEELLDLSRISSNTIEISKNQVNLNDFLQEAVNIFSMQAKEKEHDLQIQYELDPSFNYIIDSKRTKRIIQNLVGNAIKYSPKGSQIHVAFHIKNKDHLMVSVQDNGLGISQQDQDKVFDRFYQVSSSVKQDNPGTGIGLAMVKEYVDLLQGKISLTSELNKGSHFTVEIPLEKTDNDIVINKAAYQLPTVFQTESTSVTHTNKPKLLFAEDNADLRKYITGILKQHYNTVAVANGQQAWYKLQENKYDIILSDIMMPEMDGLTLLEKVRATDGLKNIPFVFLTAKSSKHTKIASFNIGLDDYVVKPFEEEELLARLNALYTNYKTRIQSQEALSLETKEEQEAVRKTNLDLEALELYLTDHLSDAQFSIDKAAEHLGITRRTLDRKLKLEKGMTGWQYLKEIQLNTARQLRNQPNDFSIQEIAEQIGLRDIVNLKLQYKERFGSSLS